MPLICLQGLMMKILLGQCLAGVHFVYIVSSNNNKCQRVIVLNGELPSFQEGSSRILEHDVSHSWRLWCHELIDWSQEPQIFETSKLANEYIDVPKGEPGRAVITLLKVMKEDRDPRDEAFKVPHATEKGRQRFTELLNSLEYPVWNPDLYVGLHDLSFGVSRRLNEQTFRVFASDPKGALNRWQKQANVYIKDLEDFPAKYQGDRYLSGYACLYAGILRMNWDDKTEPIAERFAAIERHYFDYPAIRIMAHWYRTLLAIYQDKSKSSKELNAFLQHHKRDTEWRVIEIAQQMLRSEAFTNRVLERVFNSFIRNSKPLEVQVEEMRKGFIRVPIGHL